MYIYMSAQGTILLPLLFKNTCMYVCIYVYIYIYIYTYIYMHEEGIEGQ